MTLSEAVSQVLEAQRASGRPVAVVLAGHNGSGKSTMWRDVLSPRLKIPLINADRMMLSILPEPDRDGRLADWARDLRDGDETWMKVAQDGVQAFVAHAMRGKVPFAMETVFSYWTLGPDGRRLSKIDDIRDMQRAGYFVLLFFVGLTSADLSVLRVATRVQQNGHDVPQDKLMSRFRRTQWAIEAAATVADAAILVDNSRTAAEAFTVCRVQLRDQVLFDMRQAAGGVPRAITDWLDIVSPMAAA